jgi:hypothetical protein
MLWWSHAMFGSVVLLPIKALVTGAIQGATSLRTLSWRGRVGIVLHTVLLFLALWIAPYLNMRAAKMAELGLETAPLVMREVVLRTAALFTCFHMTIGLFFGACMGRVDDSFNDNAAPPCLAYPRAPVLTIPSPPLPTYRPL